MENIEAVAVIIGVVNGIQLATLKDKTSFFYFVAAVAIGLAFGLAKLFGLNIESGILAALASSGLYKVAKKVRGE